MPLRTTADQLQHQSRNDEERRDGPVPYWPAMGSIIISLALACHASAWQPPEEEPPLAPPPPEVMPGVMFSITGGFEHQFRADIDDGGRVGASRFNTGIQSRIPLAPEFSLTLNARYDGDFYNFSGTTNLAPGGVADPWEDIHTLTFTSILTYALDEQFSVFAGPAFQFSRESGASWGDSFIGGGAVGATYIASPRVIVGGGLGVVTQIEDSPRLFPVITLDWEIVDNLRLTTRTVAAATGDTGVELLYDWGGGLETALGVAYRFRRFRLDEGGGVAPGGVGQDTRIPVWARIGYQIMPNLSASVFAGLVAAGELRLEDSGGSRLGSESYDPAAMIGLSINFRF